MDRSWPRRCFRRSNDRFRAHPKADREQAWLYPMVMKVPLVTLLLAEVHAITQRPPRAPALRRIGNLPHLTERPRRASASRPKLHPVTDHLCRATLPVPSNRGRWQAAELSGHRIVGPSARRGTTNAQHNECSTRETNCGPEG